MRILRYSDPASLVLGLGDIRRSGVPPRGLLFLALEPSGTIHLGIPDDLDEVTKIRVGEKMALAFPVEGRFYHYDSIHRLRAGQFLYNGDRRLHHPGDADDVAGAVTDFLKSTGVRNVFFGCTPHQPGSWLVSKRGTVALHEAGFVEAVPVRDGLIARRIMDHHLWKLETSEKLDDWQPIFESPLGNVLMLERRIINDRLVLTCAGAWR